MKNTLKYVSIQHELGMSIGLNLRLRPMLNAFSRVCLRRLGLSAVHFYFLQDGIGNPKLPDGEKEATFEHCLSVPQNAPARVPPVINAAAGNEVECIYRNEVGTDNHSYSFALGGLGIVTLDRIQARLEQPIVELLKPLFARLALSCQASIEHEDLLQAVAARRKAEETILFQLMHDDLTQLPNRRQLMQKLDVELRSAQLSRTFGALMFLDLDRFKIVNDTLGHAVGDQLLIAVATKLQNLIGADGLVSRLGGDEFVILLGHLAPRQDQALLRIDTLLSKIRAEFSGTTLAGDHLLYVTPSIGIELFPDGDCSADQILRRADTAMYQAKLTGLNSSIYYDRSLSFDLERRREIEKELQLALKDPDQFDLHYQSQHDHNGNCIGAEALIRWNSHYRADMAPAQFIAIAEETGLMLELGQWVLRRACADIRKIQACSRPPSFRKVSVNVSAMQFNHDSFVDTLFSVIAESGIDAHLLAVELTESALIRNSAAATEKMVALRSRGIEVAIDDFGTGYSSLSYLSRLPVNTIKIDQAFVRDIHTDSGNQAIVETIVALGRALDLQLIAEGVETQAERDSLAAIGCQNYQGFLFGRPAPLSDLIAMLAWPGRASGPHPLAASG